TIAQKTFVSGAVLRVPLKICVTVVNRAIPIAPPTRYSNASRTPRRRSRTSNAMSVGTIGQVFAHQSTSHATGGSRGDSGAYFRVVMTAAYAAAPRLYARMTRPNPGAL